MIPGNEGIINIDPWEHRVDLMPGNMIVVSDGRVEDSILLEPVKINVNSSSPASVEYHVPHLYIPVNSADDCSLGRRDMT